VTEVTYWDMSLIAEALAEQSRRLASGHAADRREAGGAITGAHPAVTTGPAGLPDALVHRARAACRAVRGR